MAAQLYLDPLSQGVVTAMASTPPLDQFTVTQFRDLLRQFQTHDQLPGVDRTSFEVPVSGGTETWIYKPEGASEPLPYIFFIHGGAFVAGDVDVYDPLTTDLVMRTGYALVFPEYKRAPEAKWPSMQEQVFEVLEWIVKNGESKGLKADNFAVVSDSAAGIVHFNVNVFAHQKNITIPYNVFINPVASLDFLSAPTLSRYECWDGPYLTVALQLKFGNEYVTDAVDRTSELASPMNVSNETASYFPPSLIITSSADLVRDEAEIFGQKLQQAGRDVSIVRTDGQIHDTVLLQATRNGPTPKMIMTLIAAELKQRLG